MRGLEELKKAKLRGLDQRGVRIVRARWTGCRISECSFADAVLDDLRIWDTQVSDCSFAGASLRGAVIGSWHKKRRNEWRQVSFAGADLRGAVLIGALFDGCDFSGARLDGVHFEQCDLRNSTFAGPLREVIFDCRPLPDRPTAVLSNLSFAAATFQHVEFRDAHPNHVVLPTNTHFIPNYRPTARQALAALESDSSAEATILRAELTNTLHGPGTEDGAALYNPHDYLTHSEPLATLAAQHLSPSAR